MMDDPTLNANRGSECHNEFDEGLPVQGVFDFESGAMDGYQNWRRQQEQWLAAMRAEWGLPIAKQVRIKLKTLDRELEGKLKMVELPLTLDKRIPLRFTVENVEVDLADIERCVVIE